MKVRTVVIAFAVVAAVGVSLSFGCTRRRLSLAENIAQADAIVVGRVAEIETKRWSLALFERDSDGKLPLLTFFYDLAVLHPETVLKADSDSMVNKADTSNPVAWMHMAYWTPGQTTIPLSDYSQPGPAAHKDDRHIWLLRRDLIFTGVHFLREVEEVTDAKIQYIKEIVADEHALQLRGAYSEISQSIFGSQLALLQALNVQSSPVESEFLFSFYESAKQQYPDFYSSYTFESYINFLNSSGLVNTENGKQFITVIGRDFLAFLTESCINTNRAY